MAGYIGSKAVSVNTTSATISDDLAVGDDLTVTDDATIGGTLGVTGVLTTTASAVFNGGFTSNGDTVTFASANSDDPLVTFKNTTNNTSSARVKFVKDKGAAGADGDDIGQIDFVGDNDAQEQTTFATILAEIADASDGAEGGKLSLRIAAHDGEMQSGLVLVDGDAEDEIDVNIGKGSSSVTTIFGNMTTVGNVGIGVVPEPTWSSNNTALQIGDAGVLFASTNDSFVGLAANAYFDSTNSRYEYINTDFATLYQQVDGTHLWSTAASGSADAAISFSESMRINSSGRLLIGTVEVDVGFTDSGSGVAIWEDGLFQAARSSAYAVGMFNKLDNDGQIVEFYKDGSAVGSIGVSNSDNLYIYGSAANHSGLNFATSSILPARDGGVEDNTVDLGSTTNRFKDLYLSGGVYLGGTGAANKLTDYEEGTFTVTGSLTSGTVTFNSSYNTMAYTKIGRQVTVTGLIVTSAVSSPGGTRVQIGSLPFTSSNLTEGAGAAGGGLSWHDGTNINARSWVIGEAQTNLPIYMDCTELTAGDDFYISATYFTND